MTVKEKLQMDFDALVANGPINIIAFGDSVTHGALAGEINDYENVYWNRLKKKLNAVRNFVPVNVINAGIGGMTATQSISRMERDVFCHRPDLVIVCFGLNDVNDPLETYIASLRTILARCQEYGCETILLTPNMLNTYVDDGVEQRFHDYAFVTADHQNSGRFDRYMESAVALANELGVRVADCYAVWKKLNVSVDTTKLLANRINHPISSMHELFAEMLFNIIME